MADDTAQELAQLRGEVEALRRERDYLRSMLEGLGGMIKDVLSKVGQS